MKRAVRNRTLLRPLAGLCAALAAACGLGLAGEPPSAPKQAPGSWARASYLVLPAENRSDDRALYWLGEALGDAMEAALTSCGVDTATRDERREIEREEMGIGPLSVPTIATRLKEAEELKIDRIVFSSFTAQQGAAWLDVTVTLQVLDAAKSRRGPKKTVGPVPLEKLSALQKAAAGALLELEGIPAPAPGTPPAPVDETNRAAYEARVKAQLEETPDKQAAYLVRSLAADPDYLRARVELASIQREADHAEQALATLLARPLSGDPETASAGERMAGELLLEAGRPSAAVDAFRRAVRLKSDSSTHISLARALIYRGDLQLASAEIEQARRLDPQDPELPEIRSLLASPPPAVKTDPPPTPAPAQTPPAPPGAMSSPH